MNLPGGRADSRRPQGPSQHRDSPHRGADSATPAPESALKTRRVGQKSGRVARKSGRVGPRAWPSRGGSGSSGDFVAPTRSLGGLRNSGLGPTQGRLGPTEADSRGRLARSAHAGSLGPLARPSGGMGGRLAAGRVATRCGESPGPGPTRRPTRPRATPRRRHFLPRAARNKEFPEDPRPRKSELRARRVPAFLLAGRRVGRGLVGEPILVVIT